MNRIDTLKSKLFKNKREISLERALLYTEAYEKYREEPVIIKRARATENILNNIEIHIDDDELIVGSRVVKPRSGILSPEMSPYWFLEEIDTIHNRPQDPFYISKEDKAIYRNKLYPYWKGNSLKDYIDKKIPEDVKEGMELGIIKLNQTDKGQGHIIPDFGALIEDGLQAKVDLVQEKLKKNPNNLFLQANLITLKATQNYIKRYEKLALEMAQQEIDSTRKEELELIAKVCGNIAEKAPRNFHEAVQLFWLVNICLQYESNASSISSGRFDQYMYPIFKKSLEEGMELSFIEEILKCLWIKMNEVVLLRSVDSAKYFAGFPTGYTIILGGVDKYGKDATNELSLLILDTYKDIKLPQPNLGARVHKNSDEEFLQKVAETIKLGTGMPQLFNDEIIIPGFLNRGISLEDARDYAVVGCVELSIPGKTYGLHDIALFNLLRVFELTLKRDCQDVKSFDEFLKILKGNISKYIVKMVEGSNIVDKAHGDFAPTPLLSTFIDGCLEKGIDVSNGGAKYNFSGVQGIGIANLSDSLYVLKKAVFEEEKLTIEELVDILNNNYENNEFLRQAFINKYPKYGNDVDEVDLLGKEILSYYCKEVEKYKNIREGFFQPGSYTVSAHIPLGEQVGATPDGRLAKEQLADGGLSPMVGRDQEGPTAVLKTVSKLDNRLTTNGSLLNVKFHPSSLETHEGLRKFIGYIKAFVKLKVQHVQFNIVSADLLRQAQKNPEDFKDLVIRVAGYSAIFVDLNEYIQNDIINRTEHVL